MSALFGRWKIFLIIGVLGLITAFPIFAEENPVQTTTELTGPQNPPGPQLGEGEEESESPVKFYKGEALPYYTGSNLYGDFGILRIFSAYTPYPGSFYINGNIKFWSANNYLGEGMKHKRLETSSGFGIAITNFMYFFLNVMSSSHYYENTLYSGGVLQSSRLVQSNGDLTFGLKLGYDAPTVFSFSILPIFKVYSKVSEIGPDFKTFSYGSEMLFTFDLSRKENPVPLRIHLNLGYFLDNAARIAENISTDPNLEAALGIPYDDDTFLWGLGFEFPQKYFELFLEYTTEQYFNLNNSRYPGSETVKPRRAYSQNPQRITPGVRFFPYRGSYLDFAVDLSSQLLGFGKGWDYGTGQLEEIMPPWQFIAQIGYAFQPPRPQLPKEGIIVGTVYDAETKKPLEGAIVTFPGRNLTALYTDKEGHFYSYKFKKGLVEVKVEKEGYKPESETVRVKPLRRVPVVFYLKTSVKTGKVIVKVVSAEGKPLLAELIFTRNGEEVAKETTDPDTGTVSLNLLEGTYIVTVKSEGMVTKKVKLRVVKRTTKKYIIKMRPAYGKLQGMVVNESREGVPAVISLFGKKNVRITSDPLTGKYSASLPAGRYNIKVESRGYGTYTAQVTIPAGKVVTLNIILKKIQSAGKVSGTVTSVNGKPLAGVVVFTGPVTQRAPTDPSTGTYSIQLPAGTYQAMAVVTGYKPKTMQVVVQVGKTTPANFVLEPAQAFGIVKGRVISKDKKKGIQAVITFPGETIPNVTTDPDTGAFVVKVPAKKLTIKASALNYKAQTKEIEVKPGQTVVVNFELEPYKLIKVTKKKIVIKQKIYFETGKAIIRPESFPVLDEIAQVLKDNPGLRIRIEGHTDSVGPASYNLRLSQKRANAVRNYLISKGIDPSRLEAVGYGESRPIAPNTTPEGRAKNRRVEFVIISHSFEKTVPQK